MFEESRGPLLRRVAVGALRFKLISPTAVHTVEKPANDADVAGHMSQGAHLSVHTGLVHMRDGPPSAFLTVISVSAHKNPGYFTSCARLGV